MAILRPQPGPQDMFLRCPADIVIYGGSAGGGKTYALLLENVRNTKNGQFASVVFRRTTKQITNPGGLWEEATKMYADIPGATPREYDLTWRFPSGAKVRFAHMEHEKNKLDWQGSQIPLICFDELTHFSPGQFWYMLSRNRSTCGVKPYIRATTNPDSESWVAEFIAWWIDQDTGLAIPERSGVIRWFIRLDDKVIWADTAQELIDRYSHMAVVPKSFTFINAKLSDNQELMEKNPDYLANLLAMPTVERGRLLDGNWKIRPAAGLHFQRGWCNSITASELPANMRWIRGWDLAATPKTELNDPDWTVGVKMGRLPNGLFVVADMVDRQASSGVIKKLIRDTAVADGMSTTVSIAQDPGQAGKQQVDDYRRYLNKWSLRFSRETGDKLTRFGPFSSQAESGNILIVPGPWVDRWASQLEGFPEMTHDDHVDATSRAYNELAKASGSMRERMSRYVR